MSDAPGGGGYLPSRCMMSGRLTPAAVTRTRTSPGRGAGTGRSATRSTSGPPGSAISITRMDVGMSGIGVVVHRRVGGTRRRHVIARQPAAESVEIRKQDTLVDVRLIELVANLPFQIRRYDDAPRQLRMTASPDVHVGARARHQREERVLVEDPLVHRRRL